MKVIEKNAELKISQLKNWKDNPRSIQKKDFERLKSQIQEFGIYKPLLVCKNGKGYDVIGGNMRLRALKELGINKADCWILQFKNKAEKIKVSLSDNDRSGYYDDQALAELVFPFKDDIDLENFKVDLKVPDIDLGNILDRFAPENEKDDEVPKVRKTKIKLGDMFELGNHKLLCGDATKKEDVERLMYGKKASFSYCDPPYNVGYKYNTYQDNKKFNEHLEFIKSWFFLLKKYAINIALSIGEKKSAPYFVIEQPTWIGCWIKRNCQTPTPIFYLSRWEMILFYITKKIRPHRTDDIFEYNLRRQKVNHPCPKPVNLIMDLIQNFSQREDIILDLFLGSGTSLIASEKTDRICYGLEIDPIYCQVIIDRWEAYTNKKAVKIG